LRALINHKFYIANLYLKTLWLSLGQIKLTQFLINQFVQNIQRLEPRNVINHKQR